MKGKKQEKGEDQMYPHVIGLMFTDKMSKVVTRIDKKYLLEAIKEAKTDKQGLLTIVVQQYALEPISSCSVYFRPYNKERDL